MKRIIPYSLIFILIVGIIFTFGAATSPSNLRVPYINVGQAGTDLDGTIIAASNGKAITFNKKPTATTKTQSSTYSIKIDKIDLSGEIVTIKNYGTTDIDLTGWKLVSLPHQIYEFPAGYKIKADKSITIASGKAKGDLKWTTIDMWTDFGDVGYLFDKSGNSVSIVNLLKK